MHVTTRLVSAGLAAMLTAPAAASLGWQAGDAPLASSAVVTLPAGITSLAAVTRRLVHSASSSGAIVPSCRTWPSGRAGRSWPARAPRPTSASGMLLWGARFISSTATVATVAWSPDGRRLGVGDLDDQTLSKGGVQVVDVAGHAVVATLDTGGVPATRLVFAGEGVVIAAVGRELRAWSLPANR